MSETERKRERERERERESIRQGEANLQLMIFRTLLYLIYQPYSSVNTFYRENQSQISQDKCNESTRNKSFYKKL